MSAYLFDTDGKKVLHYTVAEFAAEMGVTPPGVRKWIRAGLPHVVLSGILTLIPVTIAKEWVRSNLNY